MNKLDIDSNRINEIALKDFIQADKIMLILLYAHWAATTFIFSYSYDTYLYGFVGGGMIVFINTILFYFSKGEKIFRYSVAISMMLFSLIFIQQHLGRIEMHFHVFIAMAFLTLYKDIYPLIIATITTIIHHVLFNYLQLHDFNLFGTPIMIFNYGCGWDIVFLHGSMAIAEAVMLGYIVKVQISNSIALINSQENTKKLHMELELENQENKRLAKESHEFSSALDESSILSKTDLTGKITYVNQRFCDITGYSKEELIGQSHNIVRHEDVDKSVYKDMWKNIKDKKIFKVILKNKKKNNESYYVDSTIIPILDINNEIIEFIAVRYDVTELVIQRDKALIAQKVKDRFLATVSHELRTPLNSIIGFIKLSLDITTSDKVMKYLNISLESSKILLNLINNILDVSKMQSGKFSIAKNNFNPRFSIKNLLNRFHNDARQKNIDIEYNIDENLNKDFLGDWQRISQIITNLISNAIKFTKSGGYIKVNSTFKNNSLVLSVKDNGIGLSKEAQERMFNPFEQADVSTTREYGGTGLGLSISLELAVMMNGNITVQSKEGTGSTFTMTIPLDDSNNPSVTLNKEELDSKDDNRLSGHILVAEDNKTNQLLISIILKKFGLTCDIAENGLEAVDMYDTDKYNIVLMDENMPKMNGTEAMLEIRSKNKQVCPIIALTANAMKGDRERFMDAGMDDYVEKPIDSKVLFKVLKKHLNII